LREADKRRDGKKYVSDCSHCGWLSTGVEPPDRSCSTTMTRMINTANCAIEREIVPRKTPSAVRTSVQRCGPARWTSSRSLGTTTS
jgi:hypothetical protein